MRRRLTQFMYRPDEPVGSPEPTPETDGTPATEPTNGGTPAEDYQKRYEDLRPQYDRTQNELNALRAEQERIGNDPEAQKALLREWGYEFEEPEPEPVTDLDELKAQLRQELMAEIEPVKQTQAQAEQARQIAAIEASIHHDIAEIETGGVTLSEKKKALIERLALTTTSDREDGMPDVKAAYDALTEAWAEEEQARAAKRRPTHKFTPGGVAGDDKPDLSTHEGRVANAMAKLADTA